ncbi:MAG: NUDIX hydrolase [Planctomycetes bacterium]|nr:NUDIX hydrolase [Planctomycetota bacterium]
MAEVARARALVEAFEPPDEAQVRDRSAILAFLDAHPDALLRTCVPGHLTASCLLLDSPGERALLHHHRKLDLWLQFGGHADGEGDLRAAALRELVEESGIEPAWMAPAPFDLDIHRIPAHGSEPAHDHLDVRFLARAPEGAAAVRSDESHALRWFTRAEALAAGLDPSLERMVRVAMA